MNADNIKSTFETAKKFLVKHSPEIMTGTSIVLMVMSNIFTAKATPKAIAAIEDKKNELGVDKLHPIDTVKAAGKYYIPTAACVIASGGLAAGGAISNMKRNAALASACALTEKALSNYRDAVVETIGEKKSEIISEKAATPSRAIPENVQTTKPAHGDHLCYETISGTWFRSDIQFVERQINELNTKLQEEGNVSYNDFLYAQGLREHEAGSMLGWNILRDGLIRPHFTSGLADDGEPYLSISFANPPTVQFENVWW